MINGGEELYNAVCKLVEAWGEVREVTDQYDLGMEDVFCKKYPFQMSFDELECEVINWKWSIHDKVYPDKKEIYRVIVKSGDAEKALDAAGLDYDYDGSNRLMLDEESLECLDDNDIDYDIV